MSVRDEQCREIAKKLRGIEISDNAPWYIRVYGRKGWCEEVEQLDRTW